MILSQDQGVPGGPSAAPARPFFGSFWSRKLGNQESRIRKVRTEYQEIMGPYLKKVCLGIPEPCCTPLPCLLGVILRKATVKPHFRNRPLVADPLKPPRRGFCEKSSNNYYNYNYSYTYIYIYIYIYIHIHTYIHIH